MRKVYIKHNSSASEDYVRNPLEKLQQLELFWKDQAKIHRKRRQQSMNNNRREETKAIQEQSENIKETLEQIGSDERQYLDNMPECLLSGERAAKAEEAADTLEVAAESIEEVKDSLDDAKS